MSELTYKPWDQYTPLEKAAATYWDMYKDAYGVRPRDIDTSFWTMAQFEDQFAGLQTIIKQNESQRIEDEALAVQAFERRMELLLRSGAHNRAMALRWIHEAEETKGDDDFLCYTVGLPYGYFK